MNVTVAKNWDEISYTLPNGKQVEIVMYSLRGDKVVEKTDLNSAAHLVGQSLNLLGENTGLDID